MRNFVVSLVFLAILGTSGICNAGRGGGRGGPLGGKGGHGGGRGGGDEGHGGVRMNYYHKSCPSIEAIVRDIVWRNVSANPSLPAKILRLHYHDCFVRGCDGSILLDTITPTNPSEKEAVPNRSLSGYDLIDFIKQTLEKLCPGIVSCADILALAARDSVSFQFRRAIWPVFTGREDGKISKSAEAAAGLPSPFSNFTTLLANFKSNNLDIVDLVTLSGAHTIGITHCSLASRRLYNFTGVLGGSDPSLNPEYVQTLKKICPLPVISSTPVEMDPGSVTNFDSHYFVLLKQKMGVFQSDAALLTNSQSAALVEKFQNPLVFLDQFARSMIKMGDVGVLTNGQGEIRKNCRVVNA